MTRLRSENRKIGVTMAETCKIYSDELDVVSRLSELGLTISKLREVLRHIAVTANSHTEDHPSWGPGITTASEAVFSLRGVLRDDGWTREEEKGFALTVHPENKIAINIAKGDEGTGDPDSDVTTVSDKGICTVLAITENQLCLKLSLPDIKEPHKRATWYLLYCRKRGGIFGELSLPVGMSETKHISLWRERIILPEVREDQEPELTAGFDDGGYEIQIKRK